MEKKNHNIYQRAIDIINNRINPDISQGGMSYDLVIKSEDAATYTLISGSIEDTKAKLLSNIPINIGLIISMVVEGEQLVYSHNSIASQYYADAISSLFRDILGKETILTISSDGTITKES